MRLGAFLLLVLPLATFAQAPPAAPPPEVDQALRAQVTAFLKYQMEGNFRKAYELVSEDSKDYYLGAPKEKSTSAEIQKIEYSDNFTKAVVTSPSKQILFMEAHPVEIPSGRIDRWRLEDGQWKWYHDTSKDVQMTIIGAQAVAPPGGAPAAATPPPLPKDLSPEAVAAAAKTIAPAAKAALSRTALPFIVGRESTEGVKFHNNSPGPVRVEADLIAGFNGFVVEPPTSVLVNPEGDATFKVTYHPSDKRMFNAYLRLTIQPFGTEIPVLLRMHPEPDPVKP
jgi:hypothetical protein